MFAKSLIAAFAATAAFGACAEAQARPLSAGVEMISVKVHLGDLDLASREGARAALWRVRHAAETACAEPGDGLYLNRRAPYHACVNSALERALITLDSPQVTRLYAAHQRPVTLAASRS